MAEQGQNKRQKSRRHSPSLAACLSALAPDFLVIVVLVVAAATFAFIAIAAAAFVALFFVAAAAVVAPVLCAFTQLEKTGRGPRMGDSEGRQNKRQNRDRTNGSKSRRHSPFLAAFAFVAIAAAAFVAVAVFFVAAAAVVATLPPVLCAFTQLEKPEGDQGWETRKGDKINGGDSTHLLLPLVLPRLLPLSSSSSSSPALALPPVSRGFTLHTKRVLEKRIQRVARTLRAHHGIARTLHTHCARIAVKTLKTLEIPGGHQAACAACLSAYSKLKPSD